MKMLVQQKRITERERGRWSVVLIVVVGGGVLIVKSKYFSYCAT